MVSVTLAVIDTQYLVDESRFESAGQRKPHDAVRNELDIRKRRMRKILQYIDSLEAPPFTLYLNTISSELESRISRGNVKD